MPDKYAGEWVAFVDGKVVAHHKGTLRKLMEKRVTVQGIPSKVVTVEHLAALLLISYGLKGRIHILGTRGVG